MLGGTSGQALTFTDRTSAGNREGMAPEMMRQDFQTGELAFRRTGIQENWLFKGAVSADTNKAFIGWEWPPPSGADN